jgi:hypothetical protein
MNSLGNMAAVQAAKHIPSFNGTQKYRATFAGRANTTLTKQHSLPPWLYGPAPLYSNAHFLYYLGIPQIYSFSVLVYHSLQFQP